MKLFGTRISTLLAMLFVLGFSVAAYPAHAADPCTAVCYVSPTGDDTNGGAAPNDAKQTIQAALNQVAPGGEVIVAAGTYVENLVINKPVVLTGAQANVLAKGRAGAQSLIKPTVNNTAVQINASDVTINGFTFDMGGVQTPWAIAALGLPSYANLRILYNEFSGNPMTGDPNKDAGGMYIQNSQGTLIEGNYFNDSGSHAVFMAGASNNTVYRNNDSYSNSLSNFSTHVGPHTNIVIENNRAVEDSPIIFAVDGIVIRNNTFTASAALSSRVYLGGGNKNITVTGNTFIDMRAQAIQIFDAGWYGPNSNATITNNTITTDVKNQLAAGGPWTLIDLRSVGGTTLVDGNTITLSGSFNGATAVYGIGLRGSGTGPTTITNNTLNGGSVTSTNALPNTGLLIRSNASGVGSLPATATIKASNNTITSFSNGVAVYDSVTNQYGGLPSGIDISINRNNLANNSAFGAKNGNDVSINAECNWWGSASGPAATYASGNLDFDPFLSSSNLNSPCPNTAPVANAGGPYSVNEGGSVPLSGSGTDQDGDALTFTWDLDGDNVFETTGQNSVFSAAQLDGPRAVPVSLRACDTYGLCDTKQSTVTVNNVAPAITSISVAPALVAVNTPVAVNTSFTDPGVGDTHTCVVDWEGATANGVVNGGICLASRSYSAPGVYTIKTTITDDDGASATATAETLVVVYDPTGGFVTGGGWITSPRGAYLADPSLTGKATFGFVSKYQKGANIPTGNTEFHFSTGNLRFQSTSYDWLVVAGSKAQYKGSGTINGAGTYGFMLTATDGQINNSGVDTFRIKIWNKATGETVYDNQVGAPDSADPTTAISGGSIVIHKAK